MVQVLFQVSFLSQKTPNNEPMKPPLAGPAGSRDSRKLEPELAAIIMPGRF